MAIDTKLYINKVKQNLWADKGYDVFYYNFKFNDKRYRGLINLSDKVAWNKKDRIAHAEMELMKIRKKREDNITDDRLTLNTMMDKHLRYHEESRWKTEKRKFYDYNVRNDILGRMAIKDIKAVHIQDVMAKLKDRGLKPRTVGRLIEVLRPVFKQAIDNRVLEYDPMVFIKIKRNKTKKIVVNATQELKKIYDAINNEFFHDPFWLAYFSFAMQGRRRTEIMMIKWEDVSFEHNYYVLRDTKNDEEQKIYLPERIKRLIFEFRGKGEYVFTSGYTGTHITGIQHHIDKLKKRLENPAFCLHYLRNVIVSAMAEQGLESMHLSGALGHNDPNTIKKYLTMNYLKSSEMASDVIDTIVTMGNQEIKDVNILDFCI